MGFYYQQTKAQAARVKKVRSGRPDGIPIDTLEKMGCAACPRNACEDLKSPKIRPHGTDKPLVYLLQGSPTADDDERDQFFSSESDRTFIKLMGRNFVESSARMGSVVQCWGENAPDIHVMASCRGRVIGDIETTRPLIVAGMGPTALSWATGLGGGVGLRRGRLIPTHFGNHAAWYVSLPEAEWIKAKQGKYGRSEHDLVYLHDIQWIKDLVEGDLDYPVMPDAPYDRGIEYITGQDGKDLERLEDAFHLLLQEPSVSIDYETNALKPMMLPDPKIWLAAVGTFDRTFAFTLDHPEGWLTPQKRKRAWDALGEFLVHSNLKVAHNLQMEHLWSSHFFGPEVMRLSEWGDTMAQAHTLDERKGTLSLDDNIRVEFGFFLKSQSRVDPVRLLEYPLKEGMRYNAMDTKWSHALYHKRVPEVKKLPVYQKEYERKVRLCSTLVMTTEKGLPIDFDYANRMKTHFAKAGTDLKAKISRTPEVKLYETKRRRTFDPGNPDQVFDLMHDICGRDEVVVKNKRDGTVRDTTDKDALGLIPKEEVPSAPLILELREVEKLGSTYIDPLLERRVVGIDGWLHPTYNSMVAVTGRLSAEAPSVQNFPVRKYREIRGIIAAREDYLFVAADYGQIEARVFGMASEDENLVRHQWTGYDIHGFWCDRLLRVYPRWKDWLIDTFGVNGDDDKLIRKTGRQEMKNKWVFPQFFGSSFKACADDLHIPEGLAEDLAKEFWDEFKGVKRWQEKLIKFYEKNLYVETLTGRRRRWAMTKNELINAPIQGTAADIVLEAMCALSERSLVEGNPDLQPNLNVHDDLSTIIHKDHLLAHVDATAMEMCKHRFSFINVPLIVEIKTGPRWNELKDLGTFSSEDLYSLPNPYK